MLLTCLLRRGRRSGAGSGFKETQSRLFVCLMLWILQGEPITFCEEAFVSHRSSVMRQFLQNAIQLQLFKQVLPQGSVGKQILEQCRWALEGCFYIPWSCSAAPSFLLAGFSHTRVLRLSLCWEVDEFSHQWSLSSGVFLIWAYLDPRDLL